MSVEVKGASGGEGCASGGEVWCYSNEREAVHVTLCAMLIEDCIVLHLHYQ